MIKLFTFLPFYLLLSLLNVLFIIGLFSVSSFLLVYKRFIIIYVKLMLMSRLESTDAISFYLTLLLMYVSLGFSLFSIFSILVYDYAIIIIGYILIWFITINTLCLMITFISILMMNGFSFELVERLDPHLVVMREMIYVSDYFSFIIMI